MLELKRETAEALRKHCLHDPDYPAFTVFSKGLLKSLVARIKKKIHHGTCDRKVLNLKPLTRFYFLNENKT